MRKAPSWLTDEPLAAVRRGLLSGRDGLKLVQAKYGEDSATLLFSGSSDNSCTEWVVRRPWSGAADVWRYPDDPDLPALGLLSRLGRRLAYQPGRRATFVVDLGERAEVHKVVRAQDIDGCLRGLAAVERSAVTDLARVPRLLEPGPDAGWLRLDWLDGEPLHRAGAGGREAGVADVLVALARSAPPDVPAWTPARDAAKLRRYLGLLAEVDPAAADAATAEVSRLAGTLEEQATETSGWVHRDFTVRHVLVGAHPASGPDLGVLDWDGAAPGPVEKDLASMIPGLSRAGGSPDRLLAAYEGKAGTVDHELLARLIAVSVLVRRFRRAVRDSDRAAVDAVDPG